MTTRQMLVVACAYLVALVAVVYLTRAGARRVAGALAGGAAVCFMALGAVVLGQEWGLWRVPLPSTRAGGALLLVTLAVSVSPIYLITWRVAARWGWRGLAVCVVSAGVIGPPRDYAIAARYPGWMVFAPGVAPVLADAAVYVLIVILGHAVMRLVAGPARSLAHAPRSCAGRAT